MLKFSIAIFTICIFLGLVGCSDEDNPLKRSYVMNITDFPSDVGNAWEYNYYDSLAGTPQTVSVSIEDSISFTDSLYYHLWLYRYNDHVDSQLVLIRGDTVTFYRFTPPTLQVDFRIVFPLKEGATWDGGSMWIEDSCEVTEVNPYGFSKNNDPVSPVGYHIERNTWAPNEYGYYSYWLSPGMGIVRMAKREIFWTVTTNETWELNQYLGDENMTFSQFPLFLGATWEYDVYDSIANETSTQTVQIIDSFPNITFPPNSIMEFWQFPSGSPYANIKQVDIYNNAFSLRWNSDYVNLLFKFPFSLNTQWSYFESFDNFRVTSVGSLTTSYAEYPVTYKIHYTASTIEDVIWADIWVAPDVGIVQVEYDVQLGMISMPVHQKWTLKQFTYTPIKPPFTAPKFPIAYGAYWNYQVFDHLRDTIYPLHAEIVDGEINQHGLYNYFYQLTYLDQVDTEYIYVRNDTLVFNRMENDFNPIKGLVFPFEQGDGWSIMQYSDTTNVLNWEQIYLDRGDLYKAYHLQTWLWCGDECGHKEDDWYAPNIGLVKRNIFETEYDIVDSSVDTALNQTWELLDFYYPYIWIDCTGYYGTNQPVKQ